MDSLEGYLLIPPDRTQFLSKATWKARYVVLGRRNLAIKDNTGQQNYAQLVTSGRGHSGIHKTPTRSATEDLSISLFKAKFDVEPAQQWPLALVTQCQIQNVAPRKQDAVQPTLVVTFSDTQRKRRSSRAASMISMSKESTNVVLYLRKPHYDDHSHSLEEWAKAISLKMACNSFGSPASSLFASPFSPRPREASEYFTVRTSDEAVSPFDYRQLQHKSSSATYSTATTRDRPLTLSSESPSLRSKRSDISSPSSIQGPHGVQQHYTSVLPTDIPSFIPSVPEHAETPADGWAKAQGRDSTMSAPDGGLNAERENNTALNTPVTLPGPRETILDRAFQLRCIPGSEREVPGEEKLSSLARFDALMREVEAKRKQREMSDNTEFVTPRSAFEADDTSDEGRPGSMDSDVTDSDYEDDREVYVHDHSNHLRQPSANLSIHRSLKGFTRSEENSLRGTALSRPSAVRVPLISYGSPDNSSVVETHRRPSTSHSRPRPPTQRTNSTSQIPFISHPSSTTPHIPEDLNQRITGDKHLSATSSPSKRLSFTEFTKRLSSTSSLLLAQTDNSAHIGNADSDAFALNSRSSGSHRKPLPTRPSRDDTDLRWNWRPVIEAQGGFL